MRFRFGTQVRRGLLGTAVCIGALAAAVAGQEAARAPLAVNTARITIAGTSNIHAYTATTTTVRLTHAQVAGPVSGSFWEHVVKPGSLDAFEIAVPAATLKSEKEGLDKNMYKALKVTEHPDIVFRLLRIEPGSGAPGVLRAVGVLRIAGVEREVTLDLATELRGSTLAVSGQLPLLMTDFGIAPPKAMMGMLKTDPKVTVTFETVLALATT